MKHQFATTRIFSYRDYLWTVNASDTNLKLARTNDIRARFRLVSLAFNRTLFKLTLFASNLRIARVKFAGWKHFVSRNGTKGQVPIKPLRRRFQNSSRRTRLQKPALLQLDCTCPSVPFRLAKCFQPSNFKRIILEFVPNKVSYTSACTRGISTI